MKFKVGDRVRVEYLSKDINDCPGTIAYIKNDCYAIWWDDDNRPGFPWWRDEDLVEVTADDC